MHPQVEYKEMDEHLAHISDDEFYSEEDKKEKEEKDAKETSKSKEKDSVKEKESKPGKVEEDHAGEESDHSADDPSGIVALVMAYGFTLVVYHNFLQLLKSCGGAFSCFIFVIFFGKGCKWVYFLYLRANFNFCESQIEKKKKNI